MKTKLLLLIFLCLGTLAFPQCPNYSTVNYFDTTCYRRLPAELKLGQGHLGHADLWGTTGARSFDFYIPNGREGWAIAIVHQWQVMRNVLKYNKDIFNWHSYVGTLLKESFGACDPNLNFTGITRCDGSALVTPFTSLDNYTINNSPGSVARIDGCFQIDHNTGWPIYPKYYPWRWTNISQHTNYMAEANFETAALSKMYYELAFMRMMEYVKGYDTEGVFTATGDNSAATMFMAMSYNKGFGGTPENIFTSAANRSAAIASNDWLTLGFDAPDLNYDYTRAVANVTKVLSNNYEGGWSRPWGGTGWTNTADNQWHCWYNKQISWTQMTAYMNKFFPLYPEVNAAAVTAKVKTVFDAINGGGSISYRYQLSTVLDEFILNMPYDDPMQSWLYSTDGLSGCGKGTPACIGPPTTLKANGPTSFCAGLNVELETIVGTGYIYQWTRNGSNITNSNSLPHIFYATQSGTYSVKVTNSTGCTIESDCEIVVTVTNCSSCSMTATGSFTANSCTGVNNGSVSVSLTNAPAGTFTYNWTGPVSGNTATLNNVSDGTYTVEVISNATPTCKAYAIIRMTPTTILYQKINLTQTRVDCSTINLTASMADAPPATCTYRLVLDYNATPGNCWGSWDNSQLNIIAAANNANLGVAAPRANGGGNCNHLDQNLVVPNGVPLVITVKRIPPSNVSGPNFTLRLYNPSGVQIWSQNLNGYTFTQTLTDLYTVTTNCGVAMPTYTMTWSPTTELINITNGTNTTSATTDLSIDRTYTITAQHPSLAQCTMTKSIFADRTCPGGLPVEWLSFTARLNENGTAQLNWVTATEINASRFVVERSEDGIHFNGVGSVPASGNSQGTKEYQFVDGTPISGTVYYRLREEDMDGTSQYSEIRKLSGDNETEFLVFPNPSREHFYLLGSTAMLVHITISDLSGRVLQEKMISTEANTAVRINDQELTAGVYILKVQGEVFRIVKNE